MKIRRDKEEVKRQKETNSLDTVVKKSDNYEYTNIRAVRYKTRIIISHIHTEQISAAAA
jgi:hypothetical protein